MLTILPISTTKLAPPKYMLPWLTYTNKLTDKLYELSNNTNLRVLSSAFTNPSWWDRYVLDIEPSRNETSASCANKISLSGKVLHRDILLSAGDIACWFARTIIPSETYFKHKQLFSRLKNETLGDLIFADNGISRKYLKYYPIDKINIEYNWLENFLFSRDLILWARLSKFIIKDDTFFLFEVFLPGLEKYICAT